jgi:anionic cell wall polymer biosynthesis LytR-Cps2A-Psr (LCP) family protein
MLRHKRFKQDNFNFNNKPIEPKKNTFKNFVPIIVILLVGIFFFQGGFAYTSDKTKELINIFGFINPFQTYLEGESEGRTNFLLSGEDGDGRLDTIIVASLNHSNQQVGFVSIPRDLLFSFNRQSYKVNQIYNIIKSQQANAEQTFKEYLSRQIGLKIHYFNQVKIDNLISLIEQSGGVEINIENSFTDCEFPTKNYSLEYYPEFNEYSSYLLPCPRFEKGVELMDSQRSLIYSRSRKSFDNPIEAIDFARSKRQINLIKAISIKIQKLLSQKNPVEKIEFITKIYGLYKDTAKTDLSLSQIKRLSEVSEKISLSEIINKQIDYNSEIICNSQEFSSDITLCNNLSIGENFDSQLNVEFRKIFSDIFKI